MKAKRVKVVPNKIFSYFFVLFCLLLIACSSEHERYIIKADEEALRQNNQLAKYLYVQVLENHPEKDRIRYRALRGLAEVSMTQLFDYRTAVKALETIFEEFKQVNEYRDEIRQLRVRAARIYRINLENPEKALDVLSPLIPLSNKSIQERRELGQVHLSLANYEQAKQWFLQAWEQAQENKDCDTLRSLQLEIIQVYSLRDLCDEALQWTQVNFPSGCEPDKFSVAVEKAHCYEMSGEVTKALQLYEALVKENPQNARAYFFLENLKRREREKQSK